MSSTTLPIARTEVSAAPDFLGVGARVQTISDLLEQAQGQAQQFRALRVINGHDLDDEIPGVGDGTEKVTYGERFGQLDEGIAALLADNEDIRDELTAEAVRRRNAREKAIAKAHAEAE